MYIKKKKGDFMTVCVFAGHREVYQSGIDTKIEKAISSLLQTGDEFVFLTGGMGEFDKMCSSAVRNAKRNNPKLNISLTLVMPYMSNRLNKEKELYEYLYDEVIIPEEAANVYFKAAIKRRNQWMVKQANYVIAFVYRDYGGAFETVKYALKQGKTVINLAQTQNP